MSPSSRAERSTTPASHSRRQAHRSPTSAVDSAHRRGRRPRRRVRGHRTPASPATVPRLIARPPVLGTRRARRPRRGQRDRSGRDVRRYVQRGDLVGEPAARGSRVEPRRAARCARALVGIGARVQRVGCPRHVERVDQQRVVAELVGRAGLARQHDRAAVLRQDRHLLGDEVHAVADRVDQQHVGDPVQRERARVVVGDVEHDRAPVVGAELVVDLGRHALHGRGVLAVLRQVVAARVGEGQVGHLAAPLRVAAASSSR